MLVTSCGLKKMEQKTPKSHHNSRNFLVGTFRSSDFAFFKDQRSDRFYKLTCTNTNWYTTSTGTWHRG